VALFFTTRTAEKEKLFQWAGPILRVRWAFYGRKGTDIQLKDLEEAKKMTAIGTVRDDAREQFLKKQGFTNLHSVSNNVLNMKKLMNDRIDLLVSINIGIARIAAEAGFSTDQIEMLFVIKEVDLYIAFSKTTDEQIVGKWQRTLKEIHDDGTFASIYGRWYPGESPPELQN
jgi:polar amino acid transport system substrate-binding protein